MAQTNINIRMDEKLKKQKKQKIPFEIKADPFYSKNNIEYLEKVTKGINDGTAKLEQHELIL